MNTMFYAIFTDENGKQADRLYFSWPEFHADTFSPACDVKKIIDFHVSGKTYVERKASLESIAHDVSEWFDSMYVSWLELCNISEWFETMGKRYGMLTEFRENGFC